MALALSFIVVALGQPAFVPWLGLVAAACGYAICWWGLARFRPFTRFLFGTLWFTGVHMVQLSWMTADEYHGLYMWAAWVAVSLVTGVQFGLLAMLLPRPGRATILRILVLPAAWTIMEWARLYILSGYTWNPAGIALTPYLIPRQVVTYVGVYGLSFLVMLANGLVLWALDFPRRLARWATAGALVALPYLMGYVHLVVHQHQLDANTDRPLRVLLVQPGLFPGERAFLGHATHHPIHPLEQWARLINLVGAHHEHDIDLIVFPEGTVPYQATDLLYEHNTAMNLITALLKGDVAIPALSKAFSGDVVSQQYGRLRAVNNAFFCQALADNCRCDVVAGLDHVDCGECYNAAVLFQPGHTEIAGCYGKRILLPFAEYLPGEWMRPMCERYGITSFFKPGEEAEVFEGVIPMGMIVCYEETFPHVIRESRLRGAEILVNVANDGWYPHSRLNQQHFHHGRLRALENGVPLVRACCTGITAAVDSLGRTVGMVGDETQASETLSEALLVEVPRYHYKTLYSFLGDALPLSASFLILLVALPTFFIRK